jgi:hypothetical protein
MAEAEGVYRYERKYLVDQLDVAQVQMLIALHPRLFRAPYPPRFVDNIYLDTAGLDNYYDNLDGASERGKVRVRWYGELLGGIARPVLEFKVKRGLVGRKEAYPLAPFALDGSFSGRTMQEVFRRSELPPEVRLHLMRLEAVLLNRYRRCYYATADGRYRVTVDAGLTFHNLRRLRNSFLHRYEDHTHIVVELKYSRPEERHADRVAGYLPFPVTRSSKYAWGIEAVYLG